MMTGQKADRHENEMFDRKCGQLVNQILPDF